MIPDELQDQGINWVAQLGPDVEGTCGGYVFGETVAFYMSPSGPSSVYAAYSTDSGGTWEVIPPNEILPVDASDVMWRLDVPQGMQVKLLLGISVI